MGRYCRTVVRLETKCTKDELCPLWRRLYAYIDTLLSGPIIRPLEYMGQLCESSCFCSILLAIIRLLFVDLHICYHVLGPLLLVAKYSKIQASLQWLLRSISGLSRNRLDYCKVDCTIGVGLFPTHLVSAHGQLRHVSFALYRSSV